MRRIVHRLARHATAAIGVALVLGLAIAALFTGWRGLWATPDQRGAWLLAHGRGQHAASSFDDPAWRGVALMKAGRFEDAAASFAEADSAEAAYDRGNALVMLGQYPEAVAQYDRALAMRPGWPDAVANRALAQVRADRFARLQGEQADKQSQVADETYRRDRLRGQQNEPNAGIGAAMNDQAIRALWLRRVQTRPADFLRARFSFQLRHGPEEGKP